MGKVGLKSELEKRLKAKKDKKESRMIYIRESTWAWLADWCERQKPPRKPSHVIEELIEMLREQEK